MRRKGQIFVHCDILRQRERSDCVCRYTDSLRRTGLVSCKPPMSGGRSVWLPWCVKYVTKDKSDLSECITGTQQRISVPDDEQKSMVDWTEYIQGLVGASNVKVVPTSVRKRVRIQLRAGVHESAGDDGWFQDMKQNTCLRSVFQAINSPSEFTRMLHAGVFLHDYSCTAGQYVQSDQFPTLPPVYVEYGIFQWGTRRSDAETKNRHVVAKMRRLAEKSAFKIEAPAKRDLSLAKATPSFFPSGRCVVASTVDLIVTESRRWHAKGRLPRRLTRPLDVLMKCRVEDWFSHPDKIPRERTHQNGATDISAAMPKVLNLQQRMISQINEFIGTLWTSSPLKKNVHDTPLLAALDGSKMSTVLFKCIRHVRQVSESHGTRVALYTRASCRVFPNFSSEAPATCVWLHDTFSAFSTGPPNTC